MLFIAVANLWCILSQKRDYGKRKVTQMRNKWGTEIRVNMLGSNMLIFQVNVESHVCQKLLTFSFFFLSQFSYFKFNKIIIINTIIF